MHTFNQTEGMLGAEKEHKAETEPNPSDYLGRRLKEVNARALKLKHDKKITACGTRSSHKIRQRDRLREARQKTLGRFEQSIQKVGIDQQPVVAPYSAPRAIEHVWLRRMVKLEHWMQKLVVCIEWGMLCVACVCIIILIHTNKGKLD